MKSDDFRGALHAQPFRPFSFSTVDGATYTVSAPQMAWSPPGVEIVAVSGPGGGGAAGDRADHGDPPPRRSLRRARPGRAPPEVEAGRAIPAVRGAPVRRPPVSRGDGVAF